MDNLIIALVGYMAAYCAGRMSVKKRTGDMELVLFHTLEKFKMFVLHHMALCKHSYDKSDDEILKSEVNESIDESKRIINEIDRFMEDICNGTDDGPDTPSAEKNGEWEVGV